VLETLHTALSDIARRIGPSVVGIAYQRGAGSGFVIAPGRVVTNAHNLHGPHVTVVLSDRSRTPAEVVGADLDGDLAVLKADTGDAAPVALDPVDPDIGMPVIALADPGGRGLRVTFGYVSGIDRSFRGPRGRRIGGGLEHTAPLLPGSSGGPVVDASGRLVGINTHRLGEGFYLAQPTDARLAARLEALSEGREPRRVRLGIGVAPSEVARKLRRSVGLPEQDGLLVRHVEPGSPAEHAGIGEGDLIVAAGGRTIGTIDELHGLLDVHDGGPLIVELLRGADPISVTVDL
jgi:serine protease Do